MHRRMLSEVALLFNDPIDGIRLLDDNIEDIYVFLIEISKIPNQLFEGQKFILWFAFSTDYPLKPPDIRFVGKIPTHPCVDKETGQLKCFTDSNYCPALSIHHYCLIIISELAKSKDELKLDIIEYKEERVADLQKWETGRKQGLQTNKNENKIVRFLKLGQIRNDLHACLQRDPETQITVPQQQIAKTPILRDYPNELFYNIFLFLRRTELEQYRLVSRYWNSLFQTHAAVLPSYHISDINFSIEKNDTILLTFKENADKIAFWNKSPKVFKKLLPANDKDQLPLDRFSKKRHFIFTFPYLQNQEEKKKAEIFKNLVIDHLSIDFAGKLSMLIDFFKTAKEAYADNFRIKNVTCRRNAHDWNIPLLEQLVEFINPCEIYLSPTDTWELRMDEIRTANFPNWNTKIHIGYNVNAYALNFEELDAMKNIVEPNRFHIEISEISSENFCKQWIKAYTSIMNNPIQLIGTFELNVPPNSASKFNTIQFLEENNFNITKNETKDGFLYVSYEIQRTTEYLLKIKFVSPRSNDGSKKEKIFFIVDQF